MLPWLMQSLASCPPPFDFPVGVHRPTPSTSTLFWALPVDDEGRVFLRLPRQWATLEQSYERLVHDNQSRSECDARDHVFGLSRAASRRAASLAHAMLHEIQEHRCDCAFRQYVDGWRHRTRSGHPEIDGHVHKIAIATTGSCVVGHPTASHPLAAETWTPRVKPWLATGSTTYGADMSLPKIGGDGSQRSNPMGGGSRYRRGILEWALSAATVALLTYALYRRARSTRPHKQ